MSELILFPPPASVVSTFLDVELTIFSPVAGAHAGGLVPNPRPPAFVRVRSGGGVDLDVSAVQGTVYVESYALKYSDAALLSEYCHSLLMRGARDGWLDAYPVRSIDVISRPQDLPDPLTDQPRFTATYGVRIRGAVAV